MSDLKFPKETRKKKRKKHKASILQQKDGRCFMCMLEGNDQLYRGIQEHHIYGGPNRQQSEEEGLKVYLCLDHHTAGPEAVHNNHSNMLKLQQIGQKEYEKTHSREEFIKKFGKNYIYEQEEK